MPLVVAVAPDSFKGTLDARAAARAMAEGVRRLDADAEVRELPMADGGEGTAELLALATGGTLLTVPAGDPLGRPVQATLARLGDGETWAVDVASASGLTRLAPAERQPLRACSGGTGTLIRQALKQGARTVIVGLGGSATVDGGRGVLGALGVRCLDARGHELRPGGGDLVRAARLDATGSEPGLRGARLRVAHDVENPLLGERGAAAIFGPQKGATEAQVRQLAAGLARWAEVLGAHRDDGRTTAELAALKGGGAAGGIGLALHAVFGATLEPGGELVLTTAGYPGRLAGCDLVIVAEGRIDGTTASGKAPMVVAGRAATAEVPVVGVAGCLGPGWETVPFLRDVESCFPGPPDPLPSPGEAGTALAEATLRLVRRFLGR